jgi:hypothetical protein
MDITVNLFSDKRNMKLRDIKIPANFNVPKYDKLLRHYTEYINGGNVDPIIVNKDNFLLDGYCTLLIYKYLDWETVTVYQIKVKIK